MKAPDKIYVPQHNIEAGNIQELSELVVAGSTEYIRKDALLEWLENKIKIPDVSFIKGLTYLAYKDVIDKLNEM